MGQIGGLGSLFKGKTPCSAKITFPQWLNGQTIAVLTLVAALGAMTQAGFIDIRNEMRQLRSEVSSDIGQLRTEVSSEIGQLRTEMRDEIGQLRTEMHDEIGQLRTEMRDEIGQLRAEVRLDLGQVKDRLRNVELEVASIKAGMVPAADSDEIAAR